MNNNKKAIADAMILRVNWIGVVINIALGIAKVIVGLIAGSMSLIADGVHSLSDLMTDFAVIVGNKLASKKPDKKHPYGHEYYESLTSVFISLVLVILGGGMIRKAAIAIAQPQNVEADSIVMIVAFLSIVAKEWIYRKTRDVAKKTHSTALFANAWHHRSDALSSVAVLIGAISIKFGFVYGDQLATAAVGLMLILAGAKGFERCYYEFTDASVDKKTINDIEDIIKRHKHVRQWHKLRTRTVGREVFLDFHILVDPEISICIAHDIAEELENDLHESIDRPMNIVVHIEPDTPELRK